MKRIIRVTDSFILCLIFSKSLNVYLKLRFLDNVDNTTAVLCFIQEFMFLGCCYYAFRTIVSLFLYDWIKQIYTYLKPKLKPTMTDSSTMPQQSKNIQEIERYTNNRLSKYLSEEQITVLHQNNRIFNESNAFDQMEPVVTQPIEGLTLNDIKHYAHAIGYHTDTKKNIKLIGMYLVTCFPGMIKNNEVSTLIKKLTDTENDYSIPIEDKNKPLPDS